MTRLTLNDAAYTYEELEELQQWCREVLDDRPKFSRVYDPARYWYLLTYSFDPEDWIAMCLAFPDVVLT